MACLVRVHPVLVYEPENLPFGGFWGVLRLFGGALSAFGESGAFWFIQNSGSSGLRCETERSCGAVVLGWLVVIFSVVMNQWVVFWL